MNRSLALLSLILVTLSCAPVETDPDKDRVAELFKEKAAGSYDSNCIPYVEDGKGRSLKRQLTLEEKDARMKETVWNNLQCTGSSAESQSYAMTYKVIVKPKSEKDATVEFKNKIREEFAIYRQQVRLVLKDDSLTATIIKMSTIVDDEEEWLEESDFAAFKSSSYKRK